MHKPDCTVPCYYVNFMSTRPGGNNAHNTAVFCTLDLSDDEGYRVAPSTTSAEATAMPCITVAAHTKQ